MTRVFPLRLEDSLCRNSPKKIGKPVTSKEKKTDLEKREKKYFWNIFAKYHLSFGEPKRLQNFDGHIEIEDCSVCVWAWFGVCIASFKLENHSLLCCLNATKQQIVHVKFVNISEN